MANNNFASLLDHFAGRGKQLDAAILESDLARAAQRLVETGRRATTAAKLSKRTKKRALRIFREHHLPESALGSMLRLVLDSFQGMTPALRRGSAASIRFLKFEGAAVVELQVAPDTRGLEIRGQITAPGRIESTTVAIRLTAGGRDRLGTVAENGTFVFRNVPRGRVTLQVLDVQFEIDL